MVFTMLFKLKDRLEKIAQKNKPLHSLMLNLQGHFGFLINKLTNYALERYRFKKKAGYWPNLKNPKTFNEKIFWKKLNDRNPLLPVTSNKYKVRFYIREKLGEERAGEILIPLLHVTKNPEDIPFDELPDNFVVKPNHASQRTIIVRNGDYYEEEIVETCKFWLKTQYGKAAFEWPYQKVDRKIMVEELLTDEEGNLPKDYKFFVFHGECKFIQVDHGRYTNHVRTLYDRNWDKINVSYNYPEGPAVPKPRNLDEMIELSEKLAECFDMVRVDLYNIDGDIYFGELTHYSESGMGKFEPEKFDRKFGEYWDIEPGYWEK